MIQYKNQKQLHGELYIRQVFNIYGNKPSLHVTCICVYVFVCVCWPINMENRDKQTKRDFHLLFKFNKDRGININKPM